MFSLPSRRNRIERSRAKSCPPRQRALGFAARFLVTGAAVSLNLMSFATVTQGGEFLSADATQVGWFSSPACGCRTHGRYYQSGCQCSSCCPDGSTMPGYAYELDSGLSPTAPGADSDADGIADTAPDFDGAMGPGGTPAMAASFGAASGPGSASPTMIGDFYALNFNANVLATSAAGTDIVPGLWNPFVTRTFKVVEGQSAAPQDRLIGRFSYFNRVENRDNHLYRYTFGFEKTFMQGRASFSLVVPIFTQDPGLITSEDSSAISPSQPISTTSVNVGDSSDWGDLTITLKYALIQNRCSVLSTGLSITPPTGPDTLGGVDPVTVLLNPALADEDESGGIISGAFTIEDQFIGHDGTIQPFLSFIRRYNSGWFVHGFSALDIPFDGNDSTIWFNDLGIGYQIQRGGCCRITSIAPTLELHVNTPINNETRVVGMRSDVDYLGQGFFTDQADVVQLHDQVNLTAGTILGVGRNKSLALGVVVPLAGPRPFDFEVQSQLNVFAW